MHGGGGAMAVRDVAVAWTEAQAKVQAEAQEQLRRYWRRRSQWCTQLGQHMGGGAAEESMGKGAEAQELAFTCSVESTLILPS